MDSEPAGRTVAVFGSSEPVEGSPLYAHAREIGRRLGAAGWCVATGGYGGVMEAASRGAVEAGGTTLGVTCALFSHRSPNAWVRRRIHTDDLFERTRRLIEPAEAFVVLDGRAGTLAELAFVWALKRAGCLVGCPVIACSDVWSDLAGPFRRGGVLQSSLDRDLHFAGTPDAVLRILERVAIRPGGATE